MTINPKDIRTKYETLFIDGIFQAPYAGLEDVFNPVTREAFGPAPVGRL